MKNEMTYDKFSIFELKLKKGIQFVLKYLELRDDNNGLYDVTYTQENWSFNNSKIFELAERLKDFVPHENKEIDILSVSFGASRFSNGDGTFEIDFKTISFKFAHQTIGSESSTVVSTSKIDISSYNDISSDDDRAEELAQLIEEINLNAFEFAVLGTSFPPVENESEINGDEISFI